MGHPIKKLEVGSGEDVYYTKEFRQLLEDHLPHLRDGELRTIIPTGEENQRAIGDFYYLLLEYKIRPELHWVTMRLNGLESPVSYNGTLDVIYVPDINKISGLLQKYRTRKSSN